MPDRATPPMTWTVTPKGLMSDELYDEVVALCTLAYEEDFTALMATFHGSVHVLGSQAGRLVTHALWVTRWLQAGSSTPMQCGRILLRRLVGFGFFDRHRCRDVWP